jgi:hypothetical protein
LFLLFRDPSASKADAFAWAKRAPSNREKGKRRRAAPPACWRAQPKAMAGINFINFT